MGNTNRFADKIALVTGAASGIGAATAARLAADGVAGLALLDRNAEALDKVAAELPLGPQAVLTFVHDVADPETWPATEARIAERFGRIDLAVANAGVGHPLANVDELRFEDWRRVIATNLDGVFLTLQTALRFMRQGGRGGAAVVLSSITAIKAEAGVSGYGASKAAVLQLARIAAREGAAQGIRVNAIVPGGVETPLFRALPFFRDLITKTGSERGAFEVLGKKTVPLGRYARPEETAAHIAFLLSEEAATVTGSAFLADSGLTL
jgi:NAD(P)-dependent dehydrogenase (short-subunit alcohol dehydrogenase family)